MDVVRLFIERVPGFQRELLAALDLHDDDPVGHEVDAARERSLQAALAAFDGDSSQTAEAVRHELTAHLGHATADTNDTDARRSAHEVIHQRALLAARQVIFEMRASDDIGDAAFHRLEEELDWIEMGSGAREE